MSTYPPTPELDRMLGKKDQSQPAGEFLEWVVSQGWVLCSWQSGLEVDGYWPVGKSIEQLLADWLGIDLATVEAERRAVLEHVREQYEER